MTLQFRYTSEGNWYKGNTHLHSVASDGGKEIHELGKLYRDAGYDFLCLTDHWVSSRITPAETADGLLWFNGIELDGKDARGAAYHIVCIGDFEGIDQLSSLEQAVNRAHEQNGFIVLAHPFWMGNTFDDCLAHPFHAVEIYNNVCQWLIGKGDGLAYWNNMLAANPNILGIASDDAHFIAEEPVWQGGWVMVNAKNRTHTAIMEALRSGQFYSSTGPKIHSIRIEGDHVHIETSPVQYIRLVGPAWQGNLIGTPDGVPITSASLPLPVDWRYAYIEVEDPLHRRAWTNSLFTN